MTAGCARSVRRFAMGPCVQMCKPKFLKMWFWGLCKFDDMILLLLLVGGTCFLEDDTFTGQDLETKTSMNHLKSYLWVRLRLEAHRLKAFKHFRPVSPTTICSCFFFSQSITGASIIYNPIFCFLLDPPPQPPKKPLKPQIHLFFQVSCRNSTWMPWKVFLGSRDIVCILDGFHWTEKFGSQIC